MFICFYFVYSLVMHYRDFETYLAEFAATFILGIVINFAKVANVSQPSVPVFLAKSSIGFSFENLTLKHANPATTFACSLIGLLSLKSAFIYMLFQIVGFVTAAGISRLLYKDDFFVVYDSTQPTSGMRLFALELIVSIILNILVIENIIYAKELAWLNRKLCTKSFKRSIISAPFSIGAATAVGSILASVSEGGSFNPGFVFATFLVSNRYSHLWQYLVADFIGSVVGAFIVNNILFFHVT